MGSNLFQFQIRNLCISYRDSPDSTVFAHQKNRTIAKRTNWGLEYSRVQNRHIPMFINFWNFFQGLQSYYGLKRLKVYYVSLDISWGYVYSFCQIFQRLRLFKGLCLFRTLEYSNCNLIKALEPL